MRVRVVSVDSEGVKKVIGVFVWDGGDVKIEGDVNVMKRLPSMIDYYGGDFSKSVVIGDGERFMRNLTLNFRGSRFFAVEE